MLDGEWEAARVEDGAKQLHVLILTFGTRGDVEPFVAIAHGLQARGYRATICTAPRYHDWLKSLGISCAHMDGSLLDLLETFEGGSLMEKSGGLIGLARAWMKLARRGKEAQAQMMQDAWQAAQVTQPDVVLFHPKVFAGAHIAEALGVPCFVGLFQPMLVPTSAFPPVGFPKLPLPGFSRFAYAVIGFAIGSYRKVVNTFRREQLQRPPVRGRREAFAPVHAPPVAYLHAISPHVLPPPDDWPPDSHMVGYWRLAAEPNYEPPQALATFLEAGPPPVYIGFGSMTVGTPERFRDLLLEALKRAHVRGIISAGWAQLGEAQNDKDVLFIQSVPHTWLFPRMAAVVHHGGAGTTAAGFYAGVPAVICPFFGDQPFWAERSVSLGVGAPPVPKRRMTAPRLAASIRIAVDNAQLRTSAQALAAKLRTEDGVHDAIQRFERAVQRRTKVA